MLRLASGHVVSIFVGSFSYKICRRRKINYYYLPRSLISIPTGFSLIDRLNGIDGSTITWTISEPKGPHENSLKFQISTASSLLAPIHIGLLGSCVKSIPYRFLIVTRCRENLSSGEKRAGDHKIQYS
jgi:hypothetical protein